MTGVNPFLFGRLKREETAKQAEVNREFRSTLRPWGTSAGEKELEKVIRRLARIAALRLIKDWDSGEEN